MSSGSAAGSPAKFARVPLWLYESGASLQAIAVYGWLHGRYGHYKKIKPSYSTLAKELGVSRGSVIAYMQALVKVGALRVIEAGAAAQNTNTYEVAFERPFGKSQVTTGQNTDQSDDAPAPVSRDEQVTTGQPADQSTPVVSPLTGTGQPADQTGQRAVHEEDVVKTELLSPPPSSTPAAPSAPREDETRGRESSVTELRLPAAHRVIRAARLGLTESEESAFIAWTNRAERKGPAWWRTVAANGDLPDLVADWRHDTATAAAANAPAPPPCPGCGGTGRIEDPETRLPRPCPQCRPVKRAA